MKHQHMKGEWEATRGYTTGDIVSHSEKLYICKDPCTGSHPTFGDPWVCLDQPGPEGARGFRGPAGNDGVDGPPGPKGDRGVDGDDGLSPVLGVEKVGDSVVLKVVAMGNPSDIVGKYLGSEGPVSDPEDATDLSS